MGGEGRVSPYPDARSDVAAYVRSQPARRSMTALTVELVAHPPRPLNTAPQRATLFAPVAHTGRPRYQVPPPRLTAVAVFLRALLL